MGGGLMQLVAYGAQDVYLTGEPQITFFKVVYRRHTNFAIESIEQTFNGTAALGKTVTAVISRNGDLVAGMHVEMESTSNSATPAGWGHDLIAEAEIEIGGQKIDKHYAQWLEIWSQLTGSEDKMNGYKEMVGAGSEGDSTKVRVPLQFWFNRNPGLALPLIALQYHEVKVIITFGTGEEYSSASMKLTDLDAKLYVDYIYLDTEERRRFAQMSHEYLIDQLQFTGKESLGQTLNPQKIRLNFNHPVKELVWVLRRTSAAGLDGALDNDCSGSSEPCVDARLLLNGHERFSKRDGSYFRTVQPYYHHTRIPDGYYSGDTARKFIYVYSFALRPEEHQPSGTCNFSRIDNATLDINTDTNAEEISVYAVNYNVLRVVSGMGGLAYSN